jgi:acyl-CoA hydrolase
MSELPSHQLTMTVLMTPDTANFAGNVHGGTILKLLDQVAYACAARYAKRYVVTLSVDQVMFRQPIHVGELVTFLASVNHTGTSSMEVGIKVMAEDIRTQAARHVNSCFFTMVAVNDDRTPAAVAPFVPATPDEQRRHAAAQVRKQMRRELEQRFADLRR